jgi:hypothetical protein
MVHLYVIFTKAGMTIIYECIIKCVSAFSGDIFKKIQAAENYRN